MKRIILTMLVLQSWCGMAAAQSPYLPPQPAQPPSSSPVRQAGANSQDLRQVLAKQGSPDPNLNPKLDEASPFLQPSPRFEEAPGPLRWIREASATLTYLAGGGERGFGTVDLETSMTMQFTFDPCLAPLTVKPVFGIHFWDQPSLGQPFFSLGLPDRVYDLYVDFGWAPRVTDWFYLDIGLTPGVYTDFDNSRSDQFRMRGRLIGIFATSEALQFVAGVAYINRNETKWLPVAGVIWNPTSETRVQLVFPQPRISHRLWNNPGSEGWVYVGGEYGGGAWAINRLGILDDNVDYNDWRLALGLELKHYTGIRGFFEVGYVFNRELLFETYGGRVELNDTVMLRIGLVF